MDRKLSKSIVDGLEAGATPYFIWDGGNGGVKGFGVAVHPTGRKVFVSQFRVGRGRAAKLRRVSIGTFGVFTVETARAAARIRIGAARLGIDAEGDKKAAAEAAEVDRLATRNRRIDRLCGRFMRITRAARKPNTVRLYSWIVAKYILPAFARRDATDKTLRADIIMWHTSMARTPSTANRGLAALSAIFNMALDARLVPDNFRNPAARIPKFKQNPKQRFLSTEELRRLGDAIRTAETIGVAWQPRPERQTKFAPKPEHRFVTIDASSAAALRLLIFTGARLREILNLEWSAVELDNGVLSLADSKTGAKTILLNAPARAVLASLDHTGKYVLKGDGDRPRTDLNRPWALVCRVAGLTSLRLHDLRHTHASVGASAGHSLLLIGKLLGHTNPATTARYAHVPEDPLRKASDAIATSIAASMGEAPAPLSAEVRPFRKGRP